MLPTLPSLLYRPVSGTVRCMVSPQPGATLKTFFTPNRSGCGCALRPYVNYARAPAHALSRPPTSPTASSCMRRDNFLSHPVFKMAFGGVVLSLTFLAAPVLYCDPVPAKKAAATPPPPPTLNRTSSSTPPVLPPPPQSSVNFYELTFGTVCGICAGVFVKKGARIVAFALGGVFVLLQYLGSLRLVRMDWSRAATGFENLFYSKDASGVRRPPNVGSLFRWIVNFLTADFQPRATFVAGFALGIRIG